MNEKHFEIVYTTNCPICRTKIKVRNYQNIRGEVSGHYLRNHQGWVFGKPNSQEKIDESTFWKWFDTLPHQDRHTSPPEREG